MDKKIRLRLIALLLTALGYALPSAAEQPRTYTEEHPVTVICDWDYAPFEFRNNNGEPDGYNIQLLRTVFKRLKLPYKFVLKEWYQSMETFQNREADLIFDPTYTFRGKPYTLSNYIVSYYKIGVVRLASTKPLNLRQLTKQDTLIVKNHDLAAKYITEDKSLDVAIEFHSPKEAIAGVRSGKYKYFIWGMDPIKWKVRQLALDSMVVDPIDIPDSPVRLFGYDKDLVNIIDDEMARLEQSGEMERIVNQWFHPEREVNDASPVSLFMLTGIVIAIVIIFLLSRLVHFRVKNTISKATDVNLMMEQALSTGTNYVAIFDVSTQMVSGVFGKLLPKPIPMSDFINRTHPNDLPSFSEGVKAIINGQRTDSWTFTHTWNFGTEEKPEWKVMTGNAIPEIENGVLRRIVAVIKDITEDVEKERINRENANKYMKLFDTNLMAMSFYGPDGKLIDSNQEMRILSKLDTPESVEFFQKTLLWDVAVLKGDFERGNHDDFYVCHRLRYGKQVTDTYLEFMVHPAFDDKDELRYYIVTARDITAERDMYLEQQRHDKEISKVNASINDYETQMQYLLRNSDMMVWRSDRKAHRISFSRSLKEELFSMTFEEFAQEMADMDANSAQQTILDDDRMREPFNVMHQYKRRDPQLLPLWGASSGTPLFDKDGNLTGHLGVLRDVTPLINAQQRLKEETARAENSGKLKSAFLANMSHEIRTPLNAIVGFSDLLHTVDTSDERIEFIRIIRNNCDMLMRLINDILAASNMSEALSIVPEEIDFAKEFNDICRTLAQRVQSPTVAFIKDNPYETYVTKLDKGRIQQVLTNFTTNAVKYTQQGHITVGYHYERRKPLDGSEETDGLYMYCEDTGAGIPKEKQDSVFERFVKLNEFVQGTGLGLSICQAIVKRSNGFIGVTSEGEGHGSTFWFWIPCEKK